MNLADNSYTVQTSVSEFLTDFPDDLKCFFYIISMHRAFAIEMWSWIG